MRIYQVGIKLKDKEILVVGGGRVSTRKVKGLAKTGAKMTIISPTYSQEIANILSRNRDIKLIKRNFRKMDIHIKFFAVYAATDCNKINKEITCIAKKKNILVNCVDDPKASTLHVPSTINAGKIGISIFSGGASPAYVKHLRKEIENTFLVKAKAEIKTMARFRKILSKKIKTQKERNKIVDHFIESEAYKHISKKPVVIQNKLMRKIISGCL